MASHLCGILWQEQTWHQRRWKMANTVVQQVQQALVNACSLDRGML